MANGTIQFFLPHHKTVAFILCRLLSRNEVQVEVACDLPQRQSPSAVLPHHSDRCLLGAVLHELVVQVVEAEGQSPGPLSAAFAWRDAEAG